MVDKKIGEDTDFPARLRDAEANVKFLGLHEEETIEPSDGTEGIRSKSNPAADKHAGKGT